MQAVIIQSVVHKKSGTNAKTGKAWNMYEIMLANDQRKFSTFNNKFLTSIGQSVNVETTQNGQYWNIDIAKEETPDKDIKNDVKTTDMKDIRAKALQLAVTLVNSGKIDLAGAIDKAEDFAFYIENGNPLSETHNIGPY